MVRHQEAGLICTGARDLQSMQELDCEAVGEAQGWDTPATFWGLQALVCIVEQPGNSTREGFVAVDKLFRRVKIKSPGYVALHLLGNNVLGSSLLSTADIRRRRRRLLEIGRASEGHATVPNFAMSTASCQPPSRR